jgi:hypothetical protein
MIEAFIAHTSECSGWNLDSILAGSMFKKSGRTWRFPKHENVSMLDWDFRRISKSGFDKTWQRHLELAKENNFDVIMSPDLFSLDEWDKRIKQYEELKQYSNRVVMPVHVCPESVDIEIAWPMGVWTRDYVAVWEVQDSVTHLLGGSPHAQLRMSKYFPNLKTIDGNQAFWCAVRFGKIWDNRWLERDHNLSNEEVFRITIKNITDAWKHKGGLSSE